MPKVIQFPGAKNSSQTTGKTSSRRRDKSIQKERASALDSMVEGSINLHDYLTAEAGQVFITQAAKAGAAEQGIEGDDLLICDSSLEPLEGELVVIKRGEYPRTVLYCADEHEGLVMGVVLHIIRATGRGRFISKRAMKTINRRKA